MECRGTRGRRSPNQESERRRRSRRRTGRGEVERKRRRRGSVKKEKSEWRSRGEGGRREGGGEEGWRRRKRGGGEKEEENEEERWRRETHRDLGSAGLAAVEGEGHHVTLAVQLTFALVVVELQLGVVDVTALQQTHGQADGG